MANFNKIMLLGNITRDPQLSYLPSNTPVVEFGMAVNRRFRRQDGEQGEETLFIDCRAFARTAEVINQYMHKGDPIFIEGRLQLDRWQDKEGNQRSKHRVFIEKFEFLNTRSSGGGQQSGGQSNYGGGQQGGGQQSGGQSNYGGDQSQQNYGGGQPAGGGDYNQAPPANQPPPSNQPPTDNNDLPPMPPGDDVPF